MRLLGIIGRRAAVWAALVAAAAALPAVAPGPAAAQEEAAPAAAASPAASAPARPAAAAAPALDQRIEVEARAVEEDIGQTLVALRRQMRSAVAAVGELPAEIGAALARDAAADGSGWLGGAVASALAAIAVGLVVAIAFERLAMRGPLSPSAAPPADGEARLARRVGRTLLWLVGAAILTVVGFAVIEVLDTGVDVRHRTALILLLAFAGARGAILIVRAALSPAEPPGAETPAEAARLRAWLATFIVVYAAIAAIEWWFAAIGLSDEAQDLAAVGLGLILAVFLSALSFVNRRAVTDAFATPETGAAPGGLAGAWWIVAVAYLVVAWVTRGVHVLLDWPGSGALVVAPVLIVFAALIAYGIARVAIGRLVRHAPVLRIGGPGGRRLRDMRDVAEEAAGLVVALAGFALLAEVWGASAAGGGLGATLVKVAAICIVGWIAYDAARVAIDRKHAREGGFPAIVAEDEAFAPLPAGKSRLATLLPLARIFILAAILVVVVLMVLMELGVNVVPLFAGAGIFGLAIGFGSQTLVRDMISGAFFLVDDAFRVGEYVDVGGGAKGTVEKISIRSFQLRHQRGPLHTIPFGDIKQVTNMSRDWAITKLPFSFPHGTDVEKVRKVIKKVGQELLEDPAVGEHFLEPVKSQGVVEMDSNGMTFAVKFMTPPLVQALVTRAVNARLSQAFIEAGLEFAPTTVTVRIESDGGAPPSETEKRAAAAAAQQVIQTAEEAAAGD